MCEMPDRVEARDLQEAEPRLWRKAKTWFIVLLKNLTELHKIIKTAKKRPQSNTLRPVFYELIILFYSIVSQSMLLSKNRALPVSGHQFWNKGFSNTHIYFKKVNEISFPETSGNETPECCPKGGSLLYGLAERAPRLMHQNKYPFSPGNPSAGVHILS